MIDIVLIHFRALDARYLDNALASLALQTDLSRVGRVLIFDNDSHETPEEINALITRYPVAPPVHLISLKHGDPDKRCQSWSVNWAMGHHGFGEPNDWVLFTRSDYILHRRLVEDWTLPEGTEDERMFITSHAYHHALDDRMDQRAEGFRDLDRYSWRTSDNSTDVLLGFVPGWYVNTSHTDAGVWLTRRSLWREVGGLSEKLKAWGYQQTVFQKALRDAGVEMFQIPKCYFHHQHHGGEFRSYDVARQELEAHWGTVQDLHDFRDVSGHRGAVCDELGPKP